jgi:hypothetical protein
MAKNLTKICQQSVSQYVAELAVQHGIECDIFATRGMLSSILDRTATELKDRLLHGTNSRQNWAIIDTINTLQDASRSLGKK